MLRKRALKTDSWKVPNQAPVCYTMTSSQMETFSALLAFCAGNSPATGEFPSQRPVTWSFGGFCFICTWVNGWINQRETGDLRHHRAHYDVIVMNSRWIWYSWPGARGVCKLTCGSNKSETLPQAWLHYRCKYAHTDARRDELVL